jgi:DNA-binding beta-propeller fold protein YncE
MMRRTAFAALLLSACASAPEKKTPPVVWPDPPSTPRIRYVESLSSSESLDAGSWAKFRRSFLGSPVEGLVQPMGLALSADGQRLYITDFQGGRVLRMDFKDRSLTRFAPDETFTFPFNVALDADENVYVSDQNAKVVKVFDRGGRRLRSIGQGDLLRPTGIAVDPVRKMLFVSDTPGVASDKHRVLAYALDGRLAHEVGNGRGSEPGFFNFPTYLAVDEAGNLFVADSLNFRIQVFDAEGRFVRAYGELGAGVGSFGKIKGLAFDGFGNLYVVDTEHSVVQIFNRDFQPLMWFGGPAPKFEYLQLPSCIATDRRTNRIYVCNQDFARINVYELINTTAADSAPPPTAASDLAPPAAATAQPTGVGEPPADGPAPSPVTAEGGSR